jgi:hypothetical protein
VLSPAVFTVALVLAAASLALWTDVRFPALAPQSITARIVNAGVAAVALLLFPPPNEPGAFQIYAIVSLLLLVLGYAFLTGIWLLRALQGALLRG